jgi:hypothetical protein
MRGHGNEKRSQGMHQQSLTFELTCCFFGGTFSTTSAARKLLNALTAATATKATKTAATTFLLLAPDESSRRRRRPPPPTTSTLWYFNVSPYSAINATSFSISPSSVGWERGWGGEKWDDGRRGGCFKSLHPSYPFFDFAISPEYE